MKETFSNTSSNDNTHSYMDCGLPPSLQEAIEKFKLGKKKKQSNEPYLQFDMDLDELISCINSAEAAQRISSAQAWYLREKYLGITPETM